jgi:Flp pilus assembly protein TadG
MIPIMKNEKGNIIVLAALMMVVLILFAATSIDVSYMLAARNQLRSAVDASALAAASGLTVNQSTARSRAITCSNSNAILNTPLNLTSGEVTFPNYKTAVITAQRTVPLFFASLAGMNTVTVSATATAICGNRDIVLCFDRTGSMAYDTLYDRYGQIVGYEQPITNAKNSCYYFIDQVAALTLVVDRIGLVSYSETATMDRSLDRNFSAMKTKIGTYAASGNTNIGAGILSAKNHLNSNSLARTKKTIVLFSDGMANRPGSGNTSDPQAVAYAKTQADAAKSSQIVIYTISLGATTDPALMQYIANKTNGKYYYAPTTAELNAIFQEIAKRIPAILIS